MRRLALAVLILLLAPPALPLVVADSEGIRLGDARVGDFYHLQDFHWEAPSCAEGTCRSGLGARTFDDVYVRIEEIGVVEDAFSIPRDVVTYLVERWEDGELALAERCHRLLGGSVTVRRDFAFVRDPTAWGARDGWDVASLSAYETSVRAAPAVSFSPSPCMATFPLSGASLRAGDRLDARVLFPGIDEKPMEIAEPRSHPAVPERVEGRPGLNVTFSGREMRGLAPDEANDERMTILLADGLPVPIAVVEDYGRGERHEEGWRLVGYRAGLGPVVRDEGASLPRVDPSARIVPFEPLRPPLDALDLPFSNEDAWNTILNDPSTGVGAWLALHPKAWIRLTTYDPSSGEMVPPGFRDAGAWSFMVFDAEANAFVFARAWRFSPDGVTGVTIPLTRAEGFPEKAYESGDEAPPSALRLPDAASIDRLVRRAHEGDAPMDGFVYAIHADERQRVQGFLAFGTEPRDGEYVDYYLDPVAGGIGTVLAGTLARRELPLLPLGDRPTGIAPAQPPARGFLLAAGAPEGFPAAAGAVAGLAFLALALKLALPLYTRLRRERVLDHPLRRRAYEHVRASPGARQADLVRLLGPGEGNARHHLDALVRHGHLVECRVGGMIGYYAAGEVPPAIARQAVVLTSEPARRVYDLLRAEPDLSLREVGERLRMSAPNVHRHKRRLEAAGLLPAPPETNVPA